MKCRAQTERCRDRIRGECKKCHKKYLSSTLLNQNFVTTSIREIKRQEGEINDQKEMVFIRGECKKCHQNTNLVFHFY